MEQFFKCKISFVKTMILNKSMKDLAIGHLIWKLEKQAIYKAKLLKKGFNTFLVKKNF